jgi:hypothetical protein
MMLSVAKAHAALAYIHLDTRSGSGRNSFIYASCTSYRNSAKSRMASGLLESQSPGPLSAKELSGGSSSSALDHSALHDSMEEPFER